MKKYLNSPPFVPASATMFLEQKTELEGSRNYFLSLVPPCSPFIGNKEYIKKNVNIEKEEEKEKKYIYNNREKSGDRGAETTYPLITQELKLCSHQKQQGGQQNQVDFTCPTCKKDFNLPLSQVEWRWGRVTKTVCLECYAKIEDKYGPKSL